MIFITHTSMPFTANSSLTLYFVKITLCLALSWQNKLGAVAG